MAHFRLNYPNNATYDQEINLWVFNSSFPIYLYIYAYIYILASMTFMVNGWIEVVFILVKRVL